jgi:hypothetical protein
MAKSDSGYIDTVGDMPEHTETYGVFVKMFIAGVIGSILIMVTLATVGFGSTAAVIVATIGLFVGLIVILVSLLSGMSFMPSIIILAGVTLLALVL